MSLVVIEGPPDTLLTSLDNVKASLGISATDMDDQIIDMIKAASDFACRYCGRQFALQTVKEGLPGKGTPELLLSLTPIVELTSVSYNDDAMDPASLTITDAEAGIIQSSLGFRGTYFGVPGTIDPHPSSYAQERYFVIYQGGYVLPSWGDSQGDRTLPYDLERAVIDTVKAMVKSGSGGIVWDGVMSSYKIGDTAVSWGNKTSAQSTALDGGVSAYFPPSALAVLNWYKRAY